MVVVLVVIVNSMATSIWVIPEMVEWDGVR